MNNERKMSKGKKIGLTILTIVTVIYMCVYLVWRAFFTLPGYEKYGLFAFIFGIALLAAEAISFFEAFSSYHSINRIVEPEMPQIPIDWYPDVDVFIATHNEDEDILFKTANACMYMDYPDKSKVHIYICDDGNRSSVKNLADNLGVNYIGLANNTEAKAGNLNNAMSKTNSPLIVTFDADMIPNSEFLMETVPYFFLPKMKKDEKGNWVKKAENEIDPNEKIGFIQTPQTFYNADLFQYNLYNEGKIPNEQDYFFRLVNVGRNKSNAPIYAGSNTVISREALEEVGGICTGTITEDFETGLLIEAKGYTCYAIDKLLAKGLSPITISALIKQRERWARGCVYSLKRRHLLLSPKYSLKLKVAYMSCRMYWGSFLRRFIYMLSPIVYVLLGLPVVITDLMGLLTVWLPAYALYAITLRSVTGNMRTSRWSNIIDTIMFPYLILPVLAETFHIHMNKFNVTSKKREYNNGEKILMLPHIVLLILSVVALCFSAKDLILHGTLGSIIIIYWLLVNASSLLIAAFFMLGRKNERNAERFMAMVSVEAQIEDNRYKFQTMDISEGGFSAISNDSIFMPKDKKCIVELTDRDYKSKFTAKIVSVIEAKGLGWKYCFKIEEMDDAAKKEYMQIIYDRSHTLPKKISRSASAFGDIMNNIAKRVESKQASMRQQVRLDVNKKYSTDIGENVKILNFNYEYVRLEGTNKDKVIVKLDHDVEFECIKTQKGLYRVNNIDELIDTNGFRKVIAEWNKYEKGNS